MAPATNTKIHEEYIDSMDRLKEVLMSYEYDSKLGRYRELKMYRGLSNADYELKTSLHRVCKNERQHLEPIILDNFTKYAELENPTIRESVWRKMILGQHHGLPTRLLDWTRSPMVALHFATSEGDMDKSTQHDCVLWELDVHKLHANLPKDYSDVKEKYDQDIFSVDMLEEACKSKSNDALKKYDEAMGKDHMIILEPPSMDPRIVNQYSFFSVVPLKVEKIEDILEYYSDAVTKYVISRNIRWQIRDMLDQANMNERIIYPGLDGISTWLGRHYFVRNMNRFEIVTKDIAEMNVNAIVNSTNASLDNSKGAISARIAGLAGEEELQAECEKIGSGPDIGAPVVTSGCKLKARYIIHVVCPDWYECRDNLNKLVDTYISILDIAREYHCMSIAIPLLGSGRLGIPKHIALRTAIETCRDYQKKLMDDEPMDITLCVADIKYQKFAEQILEIYNRNPEELNTTDLELMAAKVFPRENTNHNQVSRY